KNSVIMKKCKHKDYEGSAEHIHSVKMEMGFSTPDNCAFTLLRANHIKKDKILLFTNLEELCVLPHDEFIYNLIESGPRYLVGYNYKEVKKLEDIIKTHKYEIVKEFCSSRGVVNDNILNKWKKLKKILDSEYKIRMELENENARLKQII